MSELPQRFDGKLDCRRLIETASIIRVYVADRLTGDSLVGVAVIIQYHRLVKSAQIADPFIHDLRRSRTIYRVNVNTSQNDSITTVVENSDSGSGWWIRRFSLTIDGTKMCLQNGQVAGSHLSCFSPPANGQYRSAPCNVFEFGACNGSVCASGLYTLSYKGWHNTICFSSPLSSLPGPADVQTQTTVTSWAGGAPVCPSQPAGANCDDCGGEWMHWAVNSDKWSSHWIGTCHHASGMNMGSNYVLLNWVDHQAILLTRYTTVVDPTSGGSGVISYGEYGGDFWIDGGGCERGQIRRGRWCMEDGECDLDRPEWISWPAGPGMPGDRVRRLPGDPIAGKFITC